MVTNANCNFVYSLPASSFDLGIYRVSGGKHAFVLIMRFVKRYFKVAESVSTISRE